jgi:hypothetical protein
MIKPNRLSPIESKHPFNKESKIMNPRPHKTTKHLTNHPKSQKKKLELETSVITEKTTKIQTPEQRIHQYHHKNNRATNFKAFHHQFKKRKNHSIYTLAKQ